MINSIIILVLVGYAYLAIKNQERALSLLLFLLPTYLIRSSLFGIPFTMLEGLILILFGVWFLKNYKMLLSRIKARFKNIDIEVRNYPFGFEVSLWLILAFVAVWVANFSNTAFGIWKAYFFEPALIYILIYNIFAKSKKTKKDFLENLILPLSVSALTVSIYAIVQKMTAWGIKNPFWADNTTRRVTSVFEYPNALGLFLAPILFLSLGLLITISGNKENNKNLTIKKIILGASILTSFLAVYFARSEGALVAIFVSFILFTLLFFFKKKLKFFRIILIGNIILITLFVFFSPVVYDYLVPKYTYFNFGSNVANKVYDKLTLKDFSGEVRKQQWRETFKMMSDKNRWFWGAGISFYQKSVLPYHQEGIFFNKDRDLNFRQKIVLFNDKYKAKYWRPVEIYMYPHNLLLNFWTELGLFGILLFIWIIANFFILAFKSFSKENKYLVIGVTLAMLTTIIHGIVDVPYFKNDLAVMFWVIVAMMGILSLNRSDKIDKINRIDRK